MTRNKWLALIAIFWLAVIGGFIAYKQYTITTGREVLLRMLPVDPRDVFRGDYMTIRYEIGDLSRVHPVPAAGAQFAKDEVVYTTLSVTPEGVVSSAQASELPPPEGALYLEGTVTDRNSITYGIESYFIPEKTGYDLSQKLRQDRANTYVRVSVDRAGRGIVRGFVVNGETIELKDLKPYQ